MAKIPKNKKTKTVIYTLEDPITNEIRYIGKTTDNLKKRLTGHIYTSKKVKNHRCNWIKSIIDKGKLPIITFLDSCSWDNSQNLEIYWIAQFRAWGFNLVNATDGGEGNLGLKMSDKVRQKLTESVSKKVYQYDLEGNFIKEFSSATEASKEIKTSSNSKICACARGERKSCKGYLWSYVKHPNLSSYKREKGIVSEEHRIKLNKLFSKPIRQYSKDYIFIKKWESAKIAAKELNLNYISIIQYLNGKRIKHKTNNKIGDFIWQREDQENMPEP